MIEWPWIRYLFSTDDGSLKEGGYKYNSHSSPVVLCFWNLLWLARLRCSAQSGIRGTAAVITPMKKYVETFRMGLSGLWHLIMLQFVLLFRSNMLPPSSELKVLLPSWRWADYCEDVFSCWQVARNEASQSLKTELAQEHFKESIPWKTEKWYKVVCVDIKRV